MVTHSGPIRVTLLGAALFQDKYLIISHFRQNLNFLEFQPTIILGPLFTLDKPDYMSSFM